MKINDSSEEYIEDPSNNETIGNTPKNDTVELLESSGIKVKSEYEYDLSLDKITELVELFLTPFDSVNPQNQKYENISKVSRKTEVNNEFILYARLTQEVVNLLLTLPNLKSVKFVSALRGEERYNLIKKALESMPQINNLELNNAIIDYPVKLNALTKLSIRGMSDIKYQTLAELGNLTELTIAHQSTIRGQAESQIWTQQVFNNLEGFCKFFQDFHTTKISKIECLGEDSYKGDVDCLDQIFCA